MQSSIRQNSGTTRLPDFRNLGTVLRVLLLANAAAAIAALLRENRWEQLSTAMSDAAASLEPPLLLAIMLLWALSPWLGRQPYRAGAAVVTGVAVLAALVGHALLRAIVPLPADDSLLREIVLALLLAGVLLAYFHLRARALSPAIAEARLQALQARIRPHFLFNSLNAVLSMVRSDPKRAEIALQDMADLFRVLMRDNRELAPLGDEVELCRQYLELEQLRLGERLTVDWNVKSMPDDAMVPPLVLQPLIENAVYHGIEPSSEPGTISINIFLSRGDVHVILRNPYAADRASHHSGNKMALANVRERLELHFDAEAALDSRVLAEVYEVHIRMPYRTVTPPKRVAAAPGRTAESVEARERSRPAQYLGVARA